MNTRRKCRQCRQCKNKKLLKGGTKNKQIPPNVTPNGTFEMDYGKALKDTQNQTEVHKAKAIILTCMDFRVIDDTTFLLNSLGYNNNYDQFILAGSSFGLLNDSDNWKDENSSVESSQETDASVIASPKASVIASPKSDLITSLENTIINFNDECLSKSFYLHIALAVILHDIKEIIIIDHIDCGACLAILTKLLNKTKQEIQDETEYEYHLKSIKYFKQNFETHKKNIKNLVSSQEIKTKIDKLTTKCFIVDLAQKYVEVQN